MIKQIQEQVKTKLEALISLPISEPMFHKGVVCIAHDFLAGDYRREMIDFLRRVPVEYFQGQDFRTHCLDSDFFAKVTEIAYTILNFKKGSASEYN